MTRYRKVLVQERAQEVNQLQKVLETANSKLAAVATDILGKSGRDMLGAMIEGTTDIEALADLARGALRKKIPQLRQALEGYVLPHHRTLLHHILAHIEFLEETLAQLAHDIDESLQPYEEAMTLLQSIPGISEVAAATLLSEIGADMNQFPCAKHLARLYRRLSWQSTKWRKTAQRENDRGKSVRQGRACRGCLGYFSYEEQLPFCSLSSLSVSHWKEESGCCCLP